MAFGYVGVFWLIMLACVFVYHWKTGAGIPIYEWFKGAELFPFNLTPAEDKSGLFGTVWTSMTQPGFLLFIGLLRVCGGVWDSQD